MWTDHWLLLLLLLLPVVNNSQRTMGRVGFTLSDYKNMQASFPLGKPSPSSRPAVGTETQIKPTARRLRRQRLLNPSPGLSENKSVPPPRASVSWEQRPTVGRGLILPVSRAPAAGKRPEPLRFGDTSHVH